MSRTYKYLQYQKCKVFHNEAHAGRMTEEVNSKGEVENCCYGATTEPTEWGDICQECYECPKYYRNVGGY